MGLDKKPTPPPKKLKGDSREGSATSPKDAPEMGTERTRNSETSQAHSMESQVQERAAPEEDYVRDGIISQTSGYKKSVTSS